MQESLPLFYSTGRLAEHTQGTLLLFMPWIQTWDRWEGGPSQHQCSTGPQAGRAGLGQHWPKTLATAAQSGGNEQQQELQLQEQLEIQIKPETDGQQKQNRAETEKWRKEAYFNKTSLKPHLRMLSTARVDLSPRAEITHIFNLPSWSYFLFQCEFTLCQYYNHPSLSPYLTPFPPFPPHLGDSKIKNLSTPWKQKFITTFLSQCSTHNREHSV